MLKRVLKWIGAIIAVLVIVVAVFLINLIWFRPWSLNLFYDKVFAEVLFDHPELLKQMFLKHAQEKAHGEWTSEESEFKAKQLHQKAEIGKIDILQTRSDAVLTQVSGQLIRSGIFQERAFSEAVPFTLKLKMLRNPNMVENGRFPTAIQDFKYEPTH